MNLGQIANLFATTYNPDPNQRSAAEHQIRNIANHQGIIAALLQIIADNRLDLTTRQACAVWLKNRVHRHYVLDSGSRVPQESIHPSDRDALRTYLLQVLTTSSSRIITAQIAQTLKTVIQVDYPERWMGLLDEVNVLLQKEEVVVQTTKVLCEMSQGVMPPQDVLLKTKDILLQLHAGCVTALEAVQAFRFRQSSKQMPVIVSTVFPSLVLVASHLLQVPPSPSEEVPEILHLILKTYKTSIVLDLSEHHKSKESLMAWGQLLFAVVNLRLPPTASPDDEELREKSEWWKAKKWACATLGRLFHRYGNPSQLPSAMKAEYGAFAEHFVDSFAPEIFKTFLTQIELYISGELWMSKKCQYLMFQFFTECIKPKSTWQFLKPSFERLVSAYVFPQLSFNQMRKTLWETEPENYIRLATDEYENFNSPGSAATTFLICLISNRTRVTFMPVLQFIESVLKSSASPEQRFGALNMTVALCPYLLRHPDVKDSMETFIMQFVTPAFESPDPYLKAIACEVLGAVAKTKFVWANESALQANFSCIMSALDDKRLPVRANALMAFTEFVEVYDHVKDSDAVIKRVEQVILDILLFIDEMDLEPMNHSLEIMVDTFTYQLLPIATQLTQRMCDLYMRYAKEITAQDEEAQNVDMDNLQSESDDEKTFAAMGVAKTLTTVISAVEGAPNILMDVQEIIIPIIRYTLEKKILDLFDNMYELVDSLTYKLHTISPNLWPIFVTSYQLFKTDAIDFLEEMLPTLDNIVSYGADVIRQTPEYRGMLVDIYTTSIRSEQLGENDRVNGSKLAESVLLNLRGCIDEHLQTIVTTSLSIWDDANTNALRLANLEVLINAIFYNPQQAMTFIEGWQLGMMRTFLDTWFNMINTDRLPRVHDKKLSILTLCALMDMQEVPPTLVDGWPGIMGAILKVFKGLPKAMQQRKALMESLVEDDEESDDSPDKLLNLNDDEGDVWDEDSAYLDILAREGARLREKSEREAEVEGADDDDEEPDDDVEEELGYISAIEAVDPYITFKHALTNLQTRNPAYYQAVTTSLDVEQTTLLMEVMGVAEANETSAAPKPNGDQP